MPIWKDCHVEVAYPEADSDEYAHCEVKIDDREIVVSYVDENGAVLYRGPNNGDGHYFLRSPDRDGQASLHGLKDSKILVGYWIEEGFRGYWRIQLK
jgi:hypothetical protein